VPSCECERAETAHHAALTFPCAEIAAATCLLASSGCDARMSSPLATVKKLKALRGLGGGSGRPSLWRAVAVSLSALIWRNDAASAGGMGGGGSRAIDEAKIPRAPPMVAPPGGGTAGGGGIAI
jgi:hypothetical protein